MMKKKFLIASLLLAASTFGAEETKWDFTGSNVEAKLTVYSSDTDASYAGKDEDLILKVSKKVDDKTTVSFKYDTDASNPDFKVEAVVNRKFNEFLEAQEDLEREREEKTMTIMRKYCKKYKIMDVKEFGNR